MALASTYPPALAGCADPAAAPRRQRWAFWRSPEGQPPWARPVLLGIAAAAAVLFARNLADAGLAPFYSVAVRSMSESWKAFIFGAFDPKATITIDKLAGSFLPQALSARIFGYHPWSLALPQVIEGVIAVLVMYRVVRRWAGVLPGLLAAAIFALTPIAASMFGHSMEDGALTMCLVLAADSWQRAVMQGRLRSLIWAGVWVGLGFQAKMMQAWMILPALGIGYLLAAPGGLGRRLRQLALAGLVMLAVSLSWIALYTVTPAADRPYVDGSTNNSAVAMVFGYNGLERFGFTVPGSVAAFGGGGGGGGRAAGGPVARAASRASAGPAVSSAASGRSAGTSDTRYNAGGFLGNSGGWTKLVSSRFGPEIGWLYPLALLALVAGLVWRGRARRTDPVRAGLVMWGSWLLTFGVIYSKMSNIPHTAYMASLAPPIAALSGAGIVLFWQWYQSGSRAGWLLPAAVAAELAWADYLWSSYSSFLPWVLPVTIAAGLAAIAVLVVARLSARVRGRVLRAGLATGVAAMLAAPAVWAASVLDPAYAGSSFDASAGPASGFGPGGGASTAASFPGGRLPTGRSGGFPAPGAGAAGDAPGGTAPGGGAYGGTVPGGDTPGGGTSGGTAPSGFTPGGSAAGSGRLSGPGGGAGGAFGSTTTLSSSEQQLYRYVSAHRDGAGYLLAVQSWSTASPYILATGQEVMPMGGFSGSVPEPTLARVRQLVATGQLRFFLLGSSGAGLGAGPGAGGSSGTPAQIASWVRSSCTAVPARDYGGSTAAASTGSGGGLPGGTGGSSGTLYECGHGA